MSASCHIFAAVHGYFSTPRTTFVNMISIKRFAKTYFTGTILFLSLFLGTSVNAQDGKTLFQKGHFDENDTNISAVIKKLDPNYLVLEIEFGVMYFERMKD